jgi:cytochrome c oxidase subunit 2
MKSLKLSLASSLLLILLSSCVGTTDFISNPGSQITIQQSSLFRILLSMAAVVFVIVEGGIIFAVIRFRHKKEDSSEPDQVHGNIPLEIIWTVIPVLLVIILFILTINTMNGIAAPPAATTDIKVNVVGHQWWWEFDYPDQKITTADELVIPVGQPVQITLTSADVVHSFWVPELAGKTDVVPGQTNHMWLTADHAGTFAGQCAEFCGIEHALMRMNIVAVSEADFEAWVKNQKTPAAAPQTALEIQGQKLVVGGACAACHTIDGTTMKGKIGPNLSHLYSRSTFAGAVFPLNDTNLSAWLKDTQAMKPGNLMKIQLPDSQIPAILAYLKTLK